MVGLEILKKKKKMLLLNNMGKKNKIECFYTQEILQKSIYFVADLTALNHVVFAKAGLIGYSC